MDETTYQAIAMIVYFVGMLAIGGWAYGRNNDLDDYMLADRGLNPWVAALSAGASDMSGWLLMGLPGAPMPSTTCTTSGAPPAGATAGRNGTTRWHTLATTPTTTRWSSAWPTDMPITAATHGTASPGAPPVRIPRPPAMRPG